MEECVYLSIHTGRAEENFHRRSKSGRRSADKTNRAAKSRGQRFGGSRLQDAQTQQDPENSAIMESQNGGRSRGRGPPGGGGGGGAPR